MAEAVKQINIYQAISKCMEEIGAVGSFFLSVAIFIVMFSKN